VLSALHGRSDDLAKMNRLVDGHRLLTLVGAGGVGKTRLAQALLLQRSHRYEHGVCFVEMAGVDDAAGLPGTLAAALGVRLFGADPVAALGRALQPLKLLLVLDNAEHLLAGVAALVAALLGAAPGLCILVTSQAALKLADERVMRVGPLAVPPGPLTAREALEFGAVALFVDRARAADSHFVLDDGNAAVVIELCRLLDGMALALELAASRVRLLGLPKLRASLDDRLRLLTRSSNRAAPARQQTLRATLEWSHALLDAPAQAVFRRLAVMAGSASLALVTAVAADEALDEWAVLDGLAVLVDRSLVGLLPAADGHDDMPRYRLLDSPRALALERLAASGERAAVVQRHWLAMARHFDACWDEHFSGRIEQDRLHQRVAADFDNGRDALAAALAAQDTESALRVAATLLQQLPRSFAAERKLLVERCEALDSPALTERVRLRASLAVTWARGMIRPLRLQVPAARTVALARALDARQADRFELYFALALGAWAAALEGRSDDARAALMELQAIEDPDWPPHRRFLGALAREEVCLRFDGDPAQALEMTRRTAALSEARGNLQNLPWGNLVLAELMAGDALAAVQTGQAQLASLRGSRDDRGQAYVRLNLTVALLVLDRTAEARAVAVDGWPQARRYDLQYDWADQLALLAASEARPVEAMQLVGFADAGFSRIEEVRSPPSAAAVERSVAMASQALGAAVAAQWRTLGRDMPAAVIARLAGIEPVDH
jgi:predicted ATPase